MDEAKSLLTRLNKTQDDSSRICDILDALDKAEITLDILKQLKLGTIVSKLRKHEDDDVSGKAKALVKKWKETAVAAGVKSEKTTDADAAATSAPPAINSESSASFRTQLSDLRSKSRDRLLDVLKAQATEASARCYAIAEAVEAAIFDLQPQSENEQDAKREYASKLRQLAFNLKRNDVLRDRLLAGDISAEQLCGMSIDELATSSVREQREQARNFLHDARSLDWSKKNRDTINKSIGINDDKGMFQCNKCKSKRIAVSEKQTRSADEPMTQFFECLDCGKRWRT